MILRALQLLRLSFLNRPPTAPSMLRHAVGHGAQPGTAFPSVRPICLKKILDHQFLHVLCALFPAGCSAMRAIPLATLVLLLAHSASAWRRGSADFDLLPGELPAAEPHSTGRAGTLGRSMPLGSQEGRAVASWPAGCAGASLAGACSVSAEARLAALPLAAARNCAALLSALLRRVEVGGRCPGAQEAAQDARAARRGEQLTATVPGQTEVLQVVASI